MELKVVKTERGRDGKRGREVKADGVRTGGKAPNKNI